MFSSYDIEKFHPRFLPLIVIWHSSMKDKLRKMDINNNQVGLYNVQQQVLLPSIDEDDEFKMNFVFPFSQQKEETTNKSKTDDNRLVALINKERAKKTTAMLGKEPRHCAKVILEDDREFFQEEDKNKGKVIYRRKLTTSYGRHQQRLQQRRQRKILQEIHLTGGRDIVNQHSHQQHEAHRHHHQLKLHQKEHQQFYVAKGLLRQPQKQFQERVQRRQAALFLYRQWQLQVRREFEDLEKIHQSIISSESRAMKKGNMVVRPIQMGFQKFVRRPSIIRERKKGEVKTSELRRYLNLLEMGIVSRFLERDSCYRISDKYLLAAAFVYFKRAGYPLEKYTPRNFFVSLYLANDLEEDEEDLKYEIIPWAIGNDRPNRIQEFLKERDHLFREIGQRGVVSRICCEEVMAIIPNSKFWLRNRLLHHAGGVRNSTIFINPTLEEFQLNNPSNNGTGVYFNYCGIVEPVQQFLLAPDIAPVPCFLCHPELAPTPPKNCPLLSLVLRQNPSIQGQTQQRDLQNTKVVRCFTSKSSDFSPTSSSDDDDDDELSFSSGSSLLD